MRLLMGVSKNRHGTYYAIKKVPAHLQEAVARVLDKDKEAAGVAQAVAGHQGHRHS